MILLQQAEVRRRLAEEGMGKKAPVIAFDLTVTVGPDPEHDEVVATIVRLDKRTIRDADDPYLKRLFKARDKQLEAQWLSKRGIDPDEYKRIRGYLEEAGRDAGK